jgi:hypothetical protein
MARSVLVDAGFLIALLSGRDGHHRWAASRASRFGPPWVTCEAVLSEAFHLLGRAGGPGEPEKLVVLPGGHFSGYEPPLFTSACAEATAWFSAHLGQRRG